MPVLPKPDHCRACVGWNFSEYGPGQGFSSLEGNGESRLYAISEALGENEEIDGLPLRRRGAAGAVFRRALDELGIDAQELTIGNVLRCRPPNNELWSKPYTFPAIDRCRHYLAGSIAQRQPTMLLALGDTPLQELVADNIGTVSEVRGFVLPSRYGIPLVATYHPAFIARGAWNLYGAFKRDVGFAAICARNGVPKQLDTDYVLHPTESDIRDFLDWLRSSRPDPFSYDVETEHMLGVKEPDDWRVKKLIQIQFSIRPGHAIVLPWEGVGREVSQVAFASAHHRWSWNGRTSDDIILRANGIEAAPREKVGDTSAGENHDLILAWAHEQPDFTAKGDDRDGDEKGIPSKLMGLQSAASFFASAEGPWKHLAFQNLQYYGGRDSDMTYRCGEGIFRELDRYGLTAGYREHKYELRWVLDDLGEHGLPVDRVKQAELRVYTLGELSRIQSELHAQVPAEVLSVHPKKGYKALHSRVSLVDPTQHPDSWPKASLRDLSATYDPSQPPLVMAAGHIGYLVWREFETVEAVSTPTTAGFQAEVTRTRARRPCIERLFNPHASSPNTKAYIRHMGYRMPTSIVTGEDTTGKTELLKLAKETGDQVLFAIYNWRDLAKTGRDYTTGKWVPGDDGRIHPTFRCGTTGSGQTTCTDPNAQQYPEHSGIAKRAKEAIRAEPGHMLVKVDMRGFHSRMIGWLANDPLYYQLADEDVHSFVSAHYLNLPEAPILMELSEEERRDYLSAVKREHGHTRNYKVKRVVHGRQFNMGVRKLYQLHGADFDPPVERVIADVGEHRWYDWTPKQQLDEVNRRGRREATKLFRLFDHLFPQTFIIYIENVRDAIYHETPNRLMTPFGHHRFFWNWDMEQAAAFGPSNCAHCHIQSALIRMREGGALRAFGACNFTHDASWLHPAERLVDECVSTVQYEFELPSTVLVDSPLGPFQCNSDAEVGYHLAGMVSYTDWVSKGRPNATEWEAAFPPKK